jgi:hypothetical protein
MSAKLETSPRGTIQFMAVAKPVSKSKKSTEQVYTVKIAFDNKMDKDWLAFVSGINDAKVVTAKSYRGKDENIKAVLETGKSMVSASSKFQPQVYDAQGNEMEDVPAFFAGSTGTAQMIVQPYEGEEGGTINLIGVVIHTLDTPEGAGTVDRETRLSQLRAYVKENIK